MEPAIRMSQDDELQQDLSSKLLSKQKRFVKQYTALLPLIKLVPSEAMYELRRLQHQQRPVTEFCNKQQLEDFFCKRLPPPQLDTASADASNASLVSDRAKQFASAASKAKNFMPEGIRLEVRGLFEQRRVSETLQGPLRNEMDRLLQQGLERRQRRVQGRRSRSGGNRHRGDSSPSHVRQNRRHIRFNLPENGQYPMPRRDQSRIVDTLMQSPALNSLKPEAREEVVSEVRNLVQQQLVTSALSGEFRGVLELNIQVSNSNNIFLYKFYYSNSSIILNEGSLVRTLFVPCNEEGALQGMHACS